MGSRVNVYQYPEYPEYPDTEKKLVGHFYPERATKYKEATDWDGDNHISVNTHSAFDHQTLYRTAGGRWVLNGWSQYEGRDDRWEFLDDENARKWLLHNQEDAAVEEHFGPIPEEEGPLPAPLPMSPRMLEVMASYLRQRAEEIGQGTDLSEFNREARMVVLREEAELLDRKRAATTAPAT